MPNGDIASARDLAVRGLLSTCEISTPVITSDATGGFSTEYAAAIPYACLISDVKTSRSNVPTRVPENAQFVVKLPYSTPVTVGQRVESDGNTFTVIAVGERAGGLYTLAYVGGPDV